MGLIAGDTAILYQRRSEVQPAFRAIAGAARSGGRSRLPGPPGVDRHFLASLNQIVCALRFFYGVTLGQETIPERIPYAREPHKLPVVLSADEVVRFLEAVASLRSRAALTAVGLRISEVVHLKVADIDSSRMVIRVEQVKGGKDRYVMLS